MYDSGTTLTQLTDEGRDICVDNFERVWEQQELDIESIINSGEKWTDESFPAEYYEMMLWEESGKSSVNGMGEGSIVFKRLSEAIADPNFTSDFRDKMTLFGPDIRVDDIRQASLGTCYFLATEAAVGEFPHRVRKMFGVDHLNSAGIIPMNIWVLGRPTTIYLDDYLPMRWNGDGETYRLVSARLSKDGSVWAALLEKAWAKMNGYYDHLQGGQFAESIHFMSGSPSQKIDMG